MRKFYWSIPALLLAGAVVWAQQPPSDPLTPGRSRAEETPRPGASNDLNAKVDLVSPAGGPLPVNPGVNDAFPANPNDSVTFSLSSFPPAPGTMTPGMSPGPMKAKQVQRTVIETQYVPMTPGEAEEIQQYQEIVATLRSEKPEAEKDLARKALQELLSVGFDRDLETRETDLKGLESRVQKLRTQLDKRKAAKQEIIDLRLRTIQNEADGLEYPGSATQPAGAPNPLVPEPAAEF